MDALGGEVLVVDDMPANLQLLAGMLKERGYGVRAVPSGALALRAAQAQPPDAILLDVNMPEMDGYEVCRRLKRDERLRDVPVLFISALSEPLDKVAAFDAGGVDSVTKPFDITEVHARVATHVRLRRMQRELEERKRAVEQAYDRLRQLEQLRDTLTHMIAHDMRSPLTGILAALDFLQSDQESQITDSCREDLALGIDSVRELIRMINDLLDVSRMEASELPLERSPCNVAELARRALDSLGARTRNRSIELLGLGELPALDCDPELIRRVLVNLLDNAIKYTPASEVVRVRASQDGGIARIEVADNGPGIPQDSRGLIFEKFGRAKQPRPSRLHSSGLGLAFCRLAVEAHGGAIGVDSGPLGHGSTFWFTLPGAQRRSGPPSA